ncbi:uncharacterized protein LOC134762454 [Penaeus indicus]|uniref:uncharacterized protein LOC134762454 n=1 Tax=Penaeus indicus TaxID=29960 RepID=UPI00300D4FD8
MQRYWPCRVVQCNSNSKTVFACVNKTREEVKMIILLLVIAAVIYLLFFWRSHPALPEGRELHQVMKNTANGIPILDLHGMGAQQALQWTEYYIRKYGAGAARIITGRGLHSQGGKPVLRKVVMDFCVRKGYHFDFVGGNEGFLKVRS